MTTLVQELESAVRAYLDDGESPLTDDEFDALQGYAAIKGTIVKTMAAPPRGTPWPEIDHALPMPGISTVVRDAAELKNLFDSGGISKVGWASHKLDGLSIELVYDGGKLRSAILRGDGIKGEDVVVNARHCRGVPENIVDTSLRSVRCELVISENNIGIMNDRRQADGRLKYGSRRAAVGMIRSKSADIHELSLLTAIVVDLPGCTDPVQFSFELMKLVRSGVKHFVAVKHVRCDVIAGWKLRNDTQDARNQLPYQLDGVVWRDNSGKFVKFKFDPTAAVATVTSVIEQLGRTGIVAPVVMFEPVNLLGTEVKRAFVHNAELIARELSGLGVGAVVLVSKRGDVIPHIERVVSPSSQPWVPGNTCPSCGSAVIRDGAIARCSADSGECPGTVIGLMRKFCMEIGTKGLNVGVLTALAEVNIVTPAQLYTMEPAWLSQLVMAGGQRVGETRADAITREMASKTEMTLGELLGAVGIPGCAKSVMEAVATVFPDPDSLTAIDEVDLIAVPGVGPARAASIAAFLDTRYRDVIQPLLEIIAIKKTSGTLTGKSFCITLAMASGSRPQVEARIRAAGGTVKSSVGRGLSFLVCNYPDEVTEKLKSAAKFGVPVISEKSLIEMLGSSSVAEEEPNASDSF